MKSVDIFLVSIVIIALFSCQKEEHIFYELKGTWELDSYYNTLTQVSSIATNHEKRTGSITFHGLDTDLNTGSYRTSILISNNLSYFDIPFEFVNSEAGAQLNLSIVDLQYGLKIEGGLLKLNNLDSNVIEFYSKYDIIP